MGLAFRDKKMQKIYNVIKKSRRLNISEISEKTGINESAAADKADWMLENGCLVLESGKYSIYYPETESVDPSVRNHFWVA